MEVNDNVNHPKHYTKHPSGIECIQITEHMGFNLGNATKYIWRCDLKQDAIEDLEKAKWYIEREIKRRQGSSKSKVEDVVSSIPDAEKDNIILKLNETYCAYRDLLFSVKSRILDWEINPGKSNIKSLLDCIERIDEVVNKYER